jgi:hypothetical protein
VVAIALLLNTATLLVFANVCQEPVEQPGPGADAEVVDVVEGFAVRRDNGDESLAAGEAVTSPLQEIQHDGDRLLVGLIS